MTIGKLPREGGAQSRSTSPERVVARPGLVRGKLEYPPHHARVLVREKLAHVCLQVYAALLEA